MARYKVTGPNGKQYLVTGTSGASKDEILGVLQEKLSTPLDQPTQPTTDVLPETPDATFGESVKDIGVSALQGVLGAKEAKYLRRGGRIGRVQALAGTLLHIKPIIHVEKLDGKYLTLGKERTIQKVLESITEHITKVFGRDTPLWISLLHGQVAEQARNLAKLAQDSVNVSTMEVLRISPVLGVHTGPGIVGMAVVPMHLMEGFD